MIDFQHQKAQRIDIASGQQRIASNPEVSVWVEASAGTGKTKVLSDRVLRLLLEGVNPNRILCLTYTKAAAVEMNNRIADRLSKWAVEKEELLEKDLEKLLGRKQETTKELKAKARRLFAVLLDTPGGVKIQTIHSFCQEILKRFPLEAKISPYFEIMDDRSAKEAIDSIKKSMLQGCVSKEVSDALAYLTAMAGEFKFPQIMNSVTEKRNMIEEYLQKFVNIDEMILCVAKILNLNPNETEEDIQANFWLNIEKENIKQLIKAMADGSEKTYQKAVALAKAVEERSFDECLDLLLTNGKQRKDLLVKKSREKYPNIDICAEKVMDCAVKANEKIKSLNLFRSTKSVLVFADEMLKRYQNYKNQNSKMDYNDLIVLTKKLLETPKVAEWVLYKLDGGIDNILIDEAQDTSPEQWAIVKALTKEFFSGYGNHNRQPTVFVVGDRKQSIYSFQGADPKEFEKMHDYFAKETTDFQDVNMEVSFRSTAAILDVVNKVFTLEKARAGVAKKEQNIEHVPSRIGEGGIVEFWPLVEPEDNDNTDKVWLPPVERVGVISPSAKLAMQIADNIKKKVEKKEILASKGRPLRYSDFLILVQRRNSFVEEMVRACKNIGVNITGVDKIKLQEQIVVNDLVALAKFTLLPDDDLNLACVLKSPLFGLNDDDLFELCYKRGEKSVWQRIQSSEKFAFCVEKLKKLYEFSEEQRPFEFFAFVLNNLQGRKLFVERLGKDCEDALDEFVNLALDFEREHIPSMQTFIEWMQKDDVEIKRDLEQNDSDAVRLMTVHGSKGLQAPIVILPDTVRFKNIKQEARWLKNEDVLFYPLGKDFYADVCQDLLDQEKELATEEYNRLLYVALTRAEERLCICGYKKKNKERDNCWYSICKDALKKIAVERDDGVLQYFVEQQINPEIKNDEKIKDRKKNIPDWVCEISDFDYIKIKSLTPSHQEEQKESTISPLMMKNNVRLYNRGKFIHKILQFLPNVEEENRDIVLKDFLNKQGSDFDEEEKEKIKKEITDLFESSKFASLFGKNSRAEVSLMGVVENKMISGQVDRLIVEDDRVLIVDYKTNRPAASNIDDVPEGYLKQMQAYKKVVEKIYPEKRVETYILWTNTSQMMRIE